MNILIDKLPTSVVIDGVEYKINSDFRTSILFSLLMEDEEVNEQDKILGALQLYYDVIPSNINSAIDEIINFYLCNEINNITSSSSEKNKSNKKVLDYDIDSNYIYSAFLTQYNIDLQDIEYLHWWKFKAMLDSLNDDLMLCKIIKFRSIDVSKIQDKEQKKYYQKMQKMYEIKEKISEEELKQLEEWKNYLT